MRTFYVPPTTRTTDNTYFQEGRKGQLNQIKRLFQTTITLDDHESRSKLIKTIISYTTLGIDTSRFFPEMILASYTNDIIEKKLIYFYLSIYAEQYPDTALMAVNTFYKDCVHSDPRIRGLSLKSLSNMKFKGAYQYIHPCLQQALSDKQAYVRRSAVLGIAKVFRIYPQIKEDTALLDKLYSLVKDDDKIVAVNSIQTINEILIEEGGIVVSQKMAAYLLNNLNSFSEYAQVTILETIQKYDPNTQNQLIAIMNILDGKLKHSSSALILATIKIFLKYSTIKQNLRPSILERIKSPLLFLVNSQQGFQVCYIVLEHIRYLISNLQCADLFISHYKAFFCQADQPTYTRSIKIEILQYLTTQTNISDIINQLDQYINQQQVISRGAIKALGNIAMKVELEYCRLVMKIMLKRMEFSKSQICNQIVIALENVIRKHPNEFNLVKIHLNSIILNLTQNTAKAAILSMTARAEEPIPEVLEYVQSLIQKQNEFSQYPAILKKEILNSTLSQFFKSPSYDLKRVLGRIFHIIFQNQQTQISLKDLSSLYYVAMQRDIKQFKQSFMMRRQFIAIDKAERIELLFNTFEIPFRKVSELFLNREQVKLNIVEIDTDKIGKEEEMKQIIIDLNPKFKMLQVDDFEEQYILETDQFQKKWEEMQQGASITRIVSQVQGVTQENMQQLFRLWRIFVIASSQEDNTIKMYFYAKQTKRDGEEGNLGLMLFEVQKQSKIMSLITKCQNQQFAGFISKYIQEFLKINDII